MTRSALPTGPCGSSTPSRHDAIKIAPPATEMARSHTADAPGTFVTSKDIRPGLAACITDSIDIRWRDVTCTGILWKLHALPNPPNGGLTRACGRRASRQRRQTKDQVVADCGPDVSVGAAGEGLAVNLVNNATTGGNAKHHRPIALNSNAPAAAPAAKPTTATHIRRNRDLMASRATPGTPRIMSAISIII